MAEDVVKDYIELKKQSKSIKEKYRALETIIFADANLRNDDRIKIVAGKKTITLKPTVYPDLEEIGIETTVTETRYKKLEEFDIDVQKALLANPENYDEEISKESIRVK